MKIVTEIGWGQKQGGIRRVALNVLKEMPRLRPEHDYIVLSNVYHDCLAETGIKQILPSIPASVPRLLWDQFVFPHLYVPQICMKLRPDVIHHPSNITSFFGRIPSVVTIHDMTPFVAPETFRKDHLTYQQWYFKRAVKKARKIITVSNNSKRDICRILQVAEEKVVVAPLAADLAILQSNEEVGRGVRGLGLEGPFFLYVGSIHPRKNVGRIIEAFAKVKIEKKIPHDLVLAGGIKWQTDPIFKSESYQRVKNQVHFLGTVDDSQLAALYSRCAGFIWPSLYEGFGLPVLEAMSFGAPVITSNTSSLPEVAGDAALLIDPLNTEELAQAIWYLVDDERLSADLRQRGIVRAGEFSWRKTAKIVLETLEDCVL